MSTTEDLNCKETESENQLKKPEKEDDTKKSQEEIEEKENCEILQNTNTKNPTKTDSKIEDKEKEEEEEDANLDQDFNKKEIVADKTDTDVATNTDELLNSVNSKEKSDGEADHLESETVLAKAIEKTSNEATDEIENCTVEQKEEEKNKEDKQDEEAAAESASEAEEEEGEFEDLVVPDEADEELIVPDDELDSLSVEKERELLEESENEDDDIEHGNNVDDDDGNKPLNDDNEDEEEEEEENSNSKITNQTKDGDDDDDDNEHNHDGDDDDAEKEHDEQENVIELEGSESEFKDQSTQDSEEKSTNEKTNGFDVGSSAADGEGNDPLNCLDYGDESNLSKSNDDKITADETKSSYEKDDEDELEQIEQAAAAEDENKDKQEEQQCSNDGNKDKEDDDDDDDVLFVETRNSPICIESEDDEDEAAVKQTATEKETNKAEKQTITTATATVTLSNSITVTRTLRTSARKSTAKPAECISPVPSPHQQQQQHQQKKTKNISFLPRATNLRHSITATSTPTPSPPAASLRKQHVVDTIDLLDSSDEDEKGNSYIRMRSQLHKTPPKRTLISAKSLHKKSGPVNAKGLPSNFNSTKFRPQARKPAPPPLPPPTPQSNFLNAVQLQPATTGSNPIAFSALISNKNVYIPNAFYGNPPSIRSSPSIDSEQNRQYLNWLHNNFLPQFCNPKLVATHSCFVLLQRSLKYKDYVHIKALRTQLNTTAQRATTEQTNLELLREMNSVLLKSRKELSINGRRFCELCCSAQEAKSMTLIIHPITNKVTLRTCFLEIPTTLSSSSVNAANRNKRTHQDYEEDDDYVPGKPKTKQTKCENATSSESYSEYGDGDAGEGSSGGGGGGGGRSSTGRSLRNKRTKRLDNFSYNEDDLAAEIEEEEDEEEMEKRLLQAEVDRKIMQKRMEAQRQQQKQAKSFESEFLKAFAKGIDGKPMGKLSAATTSSASSRQRAIRNDFVQYTITTQEDGGMSHDAEDLLQASYIGAAEDTTQIISDDDEDYDDDDDGCVGGYQNEPYEHHIYKEVNSKTPKQQAKGQHKSQEIKAKQAAAMKVYGQQQQQHQQRASPNYSLPQTAEQQNWPKNNDPKMYAQGKNSDTCVICKLGVQRLVHHYVNEHRGCEVYNSRLLPSQIKQLKRTNVDSCTVSIYKNGQPQYEALCIFCQKKSRFMLPYWYQHFTMHTGEYSYRCLGCDIRKPTRSLLAQHVAQGCATGEAGGIIQDYYPDGKAAKIEANVCTLCNYVQLHRLNIMRHLQQQHNIKNVLPRYIETIELLTTPTSTRAESPTEILPTVYQQQFVTATRATRRQQQLQQQQQQNYTQEPQTFVIDDDDDDNDDDNDYEYKYNSATVDNDYEETSYNHRPTRAAKRKRPNTAAYNNTSSSSSSPLLTAQNQFYNYVPPYLQNALNNAAAVQQWADENSITADSGEDLSFMICGMLDVQAQQQQQQQPE